METSYAIEPMQLADLEAVCALETAAGMSTLGVAGFAQRLTEPRHILLVARAPHVIAMFSGWVIVDELEVDNLVVRPDSRRQGIGAAMIREAMNISKARGAHTGMLEVRASNLAAQRLYESFGFVVTGRRTGYYHSPREDALQMCCEF
jgi:ribosomal-protein-alanine N-acetyltransferase